MNNVPGGRTLLKWGIVMCKVIIVDDDKVLRDDLSSIIPWEEHGFTLIGTASDGIKARELIDSENGADIVITDICMPYEDGIELIKKTLQKYPYTKCLVVSNYDDFKYVKEALTLGASDYILKFEIEKDNLLALLLKTKQQIISEAKSRSETTKMQEYSRIGEEELLASFWKKNIIEGLSFTAPEANQLHINPSDGYCMIAIRFLPCKRENRVYLRNRLALSVNPGIELEEIFRKGILIQIEDSHFVLLYKTFCNSTMLVLNGIYHIAADIYKKLCVTEKINMVLAINEYAVPSAKVAKTYGLLSEVLSSYFYRDKNRIFTSRDAILLSDNVDEILIVRHMNNIVQGLMNKQTAFALDEVSKLFEIFTKERYEPSIVYNFIHDLLTRMKYMLKEAGADVSDNSTQKIKLQEFYNISSLHEYVKSLVYTYANKMEESLYAQSTRLEIKRSIEYIEKYYNSNITLEEVADYVGLSKNHFCRLFKKELGDNFVSYINRYRIQKAKFLMKHTNQRIKEVASNVGLNDYRYFCKVFKEIEKVTPTDYKNDIDGEKTKCHADV